VLLVGAQEGDYIFGFFVDMRFVAIVFIDGFFGLDKFSNINSRRLSHFFQAVC